MGAAGPWRARQRGARRATEPNVPPQTVKLDDEQVRLIVKSAYFAVEAKWYGWSEEEKFKREVARARPKMERERVRERRRWEREELWDRKAQDIRSIHRA
jgi:hypothetical protein